MKYCLTKDELLIVIDNLNILLAKNSFNSGNNHLDALIANSQDMQDEILTSNYFFSKIIEFNVNKSQIVKEYYSLTNYMLCYYEEYGHSFIDFLITHLPDQNLSLEENIFEIHVKLQNNNYGGTLRS